MTSKTTMTADDAANFWATIKAAAEKNGKAETTLAQDMADRFEASLKAIRPLPLFPAK